MHAGQSGWFIVIGTRVQALYAEPFRKGGHARYFHVQWGFFFMALLRAYSNASAVMKPGWRIMEVQRNVFLSAEGFCPEFHQSPSKGRTTYSR